MTGAEAEELHLAAMRWERARNAACTAPLGSKQVWTDLGAAEAALAAVLRKMRHEDVPKPVPLWGWDRKDRNSDNCRIENGSKQCGCAWGQCDKGFIL